LLHSIRCVVGTAFGSRVDPDVKRNFAIVSPVTASCAASTPAGRVEQRREPRDAVHPSGAVTTTRSTSLGTAASSAARKAAPSDANTSPGVSSASAWRSLP
jgi:hypothetical protein